MFITMELYNKIYAMRKDGYSIHSICTTLGKHKVFVVKVIEVLAKDGKLPKLELLGRTNNLIL